MKTANRKTATAKRKPKPKVRYSFPIVIERDEEGYYANCPSLQGCFTDGDTFEEAMKNIQEVIELHVESRLDHGEEVPASGVVSFAMVDVEV
jgi:predicted RNase H-like HicB family nuclease